MSRAFVDDAILVCQTCGLPFAVRPWQVNSELTGRAAQATCSMPCKYRARRRRVAARCAACGKHLELPASQAHKVGSGRHYCSYECKWRGMSLYQRGRDNHGYKGRTHHGDYILISLAELSGRALELAREMVGGRRGTHARHIFEHRLNKAIEINRPLSSDEVVHHRNGVKDDNRLENLELCSNGGHRRKHEEVNAEVLALRAEVERLEAMLAERELVLA